MSVHAQRTAKRPNRKGRQRGAAAQPSERGKEKGDIERTQLRQTIVSCLPIAYPRHVGEKPVSLEESVWRPEKTKAPRNGKGGANIRLSKSERKMVAEATYKVVAVAFAQARLVGEHIEHLAEHFSSIGCTDKGDVEQYFRAANRTLASLYFVAKQPRPSPDGLKRLALRYALDARRAIEGDLRRFETRRTERGWEIVEYQTAVERGIPFQLPGRAVQDIYTVSVLDFALVNPPRIFDLMGLIENLIGGVPSESDCLGPDDQFAEAQQRPRIRVELQKNTIWLDQEPFLVTAAQAYLLDAIVAARGDWVSVKQLVSELHRTMIGSRPDRVCKALPEPIRLLIEPGGGRGFRLKWRE